VRDSRLLHRSTRDKSLPALRLLLFPNPVQAKRNLSLLNRSRSRKRSLRPWWRNGSSETSQSGQDESAVIPRASILSNGWNRTLSGQHQCRVPGRFVLRNGRHSSGFHSGLQRVQRSLIPIPLGKRVSVPCYRSRYSIRWKRENDRKQGSKEERKTKELIWFILSYLIHSIRSLIVRELNTCCYVCLV